MKKWTWILEITCNAKYTYSNLHEQYTKKMYEKIFYYNIIDKNVEKNNNLCLKKNNSKKRHSFYSKKKNIFKNPTKISIWFYEVHP